MNTVFFNGATADESTLCIAIIDKGRKLEVYTREAADQDHEQSVRGWTQQGVVELGTYRLFRPDHDAQFISDGKRVWKPE